MVVVELESDGRGGWRGGGVVSDDSGDGSWGGACWSVVVPGLEWSEMVVVGVEWGGAVWSEVVVVVVGVVVEVRRRWLGSNGIALVFTVEVGMGTASVIGVEWGDGHCGGGGSGGGWHGLVGTG